MLGQRDQPRRCAAQEVNQLDALELTNQLATGSAKHRRTAGGTRVAFVRSTWEPNDSKYASMSRTINRTRRDSSMTSLP